MFGKSASRRHRRFLVLAMYLALAIWVINEQLPLEPYTDAWNSLTLGLVFALKVLLSIGLFVFGIVAMRTLVNSTQGIASKAENTLDERQRTVRDRAYRSSYKALAYVLLAVAVYVFLASRLGVGWMYLPVGEDLAEVFLGAFFLVFTLPTAIIAWKEPDLDEDPDGGTRG